MDRIRIQYRKIYLTVHLISDKQVVDLVKSRLVANW